MSFGGSVAGMISALKGNKSLLGKAKKRGFKSNNRNGIYSDQKGESLEFKEVSEKELKIIKEKIHLQLKENRLRQLKTLLVSFVVGTIILLWVFVYKLDFF